MISYLSRTHRCILIDNFVSMTSRIDITIRFGDQLKLFLSVSPSRIIRDFLRWYFIPSWKLLLDFRFNVIALIVTHNLHARQKWDWNVLYRSWQITLWNVETRACGSIWFLIPWNSEFWSTVWLYFAFGHWVKYDNCKRQFHDMIVREN